MNSTQKNWVGRTIVTLCLLNSFAVKAMDPNQIPEQKPQQTSSEKQSKDENTRALEGNYKFGKCLAMWAATAAVIGGAHWLNDHEHPNNYISAENMNNVCGVTFLSGFLGGIDFIADKDVKTVTEQTILRVPTIMLVHWMTSSQKGIKILMNCPVLKDFIGYKETVNPETEEVEEANLDECRNRAATLGTLFYVTAIRPGLDKVWTYGKDMAWEAKDWIKNATGLPN